MTGFAEHEAYAPATAEAQGHRDGDQLFFNRRQTNYENENILSVKNNYYQTNVVRKGNDKRFQVKSQAVK